MDTISAETCSITDAVGPTLYVDLSIGSACASSSPPSSLVLCYVIEGPELESVNFEKILDILRSLTGVFRFKI